MFRLWPLLICLSTAILVSCVARSGPAQQEEVFKSDTLQLIKLIDRDNDGRLSIDEFLAQQVPAQARSLYTAEIMRKQFAAIDLNHDGYLVPSEFEEIRARVLKEHVQWP